MISRLRRPDRRTYEALFRHPAPEDLEWRAVRALIGALAEVQEGRKGVFKATRRGVMATFQAPRDKEPLSAAEIVEVRHFIERSSEGVSMPVVAEGTQVLVAVDAAGVRIYRIEMGAAGDGVAIPARLEPFHANGYPSQLRSSHASPDGRPQPVDLGFFKVFARSLQGIEGILLLGCGADGGRAVEALRSELERMHPEVSRRVVGTRVLKGRPSEERLLAHARDFYTDAGLG